MNALNLKKHFSATASDRSNIQAGDILQDGRCYLYVVANGGYLIPIRMSYGGMVDGRFSWDDSDIMPPTVALADLVKWNGKLE